MSSRLSAEMSVCLSRCLSVCYHPPTKLREGNVFSRVSLSLCSQKGFHCTGPRPNTRDMFKPFHCEGRTSTNGRLVFYLNAFLSLSCNYLRHVNLSLYLSVCLIKHLKISIGLDIYRPFSVCRSLFMFLSVYLSVCLSVCLFIW